MSIVERARKRLEDLKRYSDSDDCIVKRVKVDRNDPLVKRIVEKFSRK